METQVIVPKKRIRTLPDSEERKIIAEKVIDGMRNGLSLRKSALAANISPQNFLVWCEQNQGLMEQYIRAREELIERMADEILDIADSPTPTTDNGATDSGAVQDKRLRIDTRKWLLSKLAPKKYGDKLELSGDANNPIAIAKIERVIVDGQAKRVEDE